MTVEYPESVDLVVLGTGLVQSVIACAAARQGKSVLIVDSNEFYGEAGATQSLPEFRSWLENQAQCGGDQEEQEEQATTEQPPDNDVPAEIRLRAKVTGTVGNVDTWFREEASKPEPKFCIDLAHQGLESTGPCVQGIRDIGLHNYLEFSAVTSALTLHQGRLCGIPASRADVHAASWLSAEGKRNLNLFLSTAQQAAAGSVSEIFQSSHFKAAMDEFGLPESVQDGVLYSVYSADTKITSTTALDGTTVLEAMVKYMAQSGVYVAGQAPFIELHYGCGEVAQAFVRNCCVHGGQVALGVQVSGVVVQDGAVSGVKLGGGHTVSCTALVGSFGYVSQLHKCVLSDATESFKSTEHSEEKECSAVGSGGSKCVARAIVAVSRPVLEHLTNCKIVIPPGECRNEHTVTVWQCHDTLHSCPTGSVLLYLSMNAADVSNTQEVLQQCVVSLLSAGGKGESSIALNEGVCTDAAAAQTDEALSSSTEESAVPPEDIGVVRGPPETIQECPEVTFACFFTQALPDAAHLKLPASVACCGDAGASSEMDSSFLEAEEIFARLFPDVVFLTKAPAVGVEASKGEEEQGDDLDKALKALGLA